MNNTININKPSNRATLITFLINDITIPIAKKTINILP